MNPALIGIDPLFLTNVKLLIKDILELGQAQEAPIEIFTLYGHVIKFVEICGIVVGVETGSTFTTYTVDDSTGTIACCLWNETLKFRHRPLEIGTSVRLDGKLATFREERQIIAYNIYPLSDPNQELIHVLQATLLEKEYKKKFKLPAQIELHSENITKQLNREVDEQLILDTQYHSNLTEQAFEDALLDYWRREYTEQFSATSSRDVPVLIEMATQLVMQSGKDKPSKRDISERFSLGLQNLLRKGLVVEINRKSNLYKAIDEQRLAELIVHIISDMLSQTKHQQGGIRIEYIVSKVAEVPEFESFGRYRYKIYKTVEDLIEKSIIYPTGEREYKVLL